MKDTLSRLEKRLPLHEVNLPDFPLIRYITLFITGLLLIALGWIIGLSLSLPPTPDAADTQERMRLLTLAMGAGTGVALTILLTWAYTARQHWQTSQALRESEERYRRLVEVLPDGVIVHSEGEVLWINPAVADAIGIESIAEVIGRPVMDFVHPDYREEVEQRIQQALQSGDPMPLAYEKFIFDGAVIDVEVTGAPFVYEGQRAMLTVVRDVTKRRRLEHDAAERRSYLEGLLESAIDAIVTLDEKHRILEWNPSAEKLFGYSAEEAVGHNLDNLIAEPNFEMMKQAVGFTRHVLSGKPVPPTETVRYRKDGEPVHVILSGAPIQIEGKFAGVVATYTDVTARKRVEEEVNRLAAAVQTSTDSIVICDIEGQVIYANSATARLHHIENEDELIGENVFEWFAPEEQERALAAMRETLDKGGISGREFTALAKDGARIPIEISATVLRDENGELTGFAAVTRDASARKRVEDELLQYAAELEDRNEELDAFAHTVAHDLKNPLTYIVGYAELAKADYDRLSSAELKYHLDVIMRNARRASDIVDGLLLLASARRMDVEPEPLDMGEIVTEALERLYWEIEDSGAEVIVPQASAWPVALGSQAWIEEVWVNYISNAIKYGGRPKEGIQPHIELGCDEKEFAALHTCKPANSLRFWVRDNGRGLTAEEQGRLFVPFTRLDNIGIKGHGLGLSIVQRIVEKLGGQVGVESEPGSGSTFYFTLPAQVGEADKEPDDERKH